MDMIGHNHKRIQSYVVKMGRDGGPISMGNTPRHRQPHDAVADRSKELDVLVRADRDEIPSGIPVIPAGQAGGFDTVLAFEFGHRFSR